MLNTYKTLLTKKTQLNSNTYLYHFDLLEPNEIIFSAGQYIILRVPTGKGFVTRLYSIASVPNTKNSFELIVAIVPGGIASNYLFSLKENTEIIFYGVAGMFGLKANEKEKIFMVTGTGIAPARSMLNSEFRIKNSKLFWGLKTYEDVYMFDDFKQFNLKICLSREQNLNMIPEEDKKYFELGHIDLCFLKQLNNETIKQLNNFDFYLCGGRQIVESLRLFLLNKNVPKENIVLEKF